MTGYSKSNGSIQADVCRRLALPQSTDAFGKATVVQRGCWRVWHHRKFRVRQVHVQIAADIGSAASNDCKRDLRPARRTNVVGPALPSLTNAEADLVRRSSGSAR